MLTQEHDDRDWEWDGNAGIRWHCERVGGISLYHENESQPVPVKTASANEYPIRFVKSGKALLVAEQTGDELVLTVIDLASGHRETWKRIPDNYSSREPALRCDAGLEILHVSLSQILVGALYRRKLALNQRLNVPSITRATLGV